MARRHRDWQQDVAKRIRPPPSLEGNGLEGEHGAGKALSDDATVTETIVRCLHNPCYVMQGVVFCTVLSFIVFTMGIALRLW